MPQPVLKPGWKRVCVMVRPESLAIFDDAIRILHRSRNSMFVEWFEMNLASVCAAADAYRNAALTVKNRVFPARRGAGKRGAHGQRTTSAGGKPRSDR